MGIEPTTSRVVVRHSNRVAEKLAQQQLEVTLNHYNPPPLNVTRPDMPATACHMTLFLLYYSVDCFTSGSLKPLEMFPGQTCLPQHVI
ncbi:hypothetical protein DPMN_111935 [Dreissena polymorpha]|uniref:Uncharacterized protein n=1 Tax=Dreissena polymorpha TaxID=45954 RepID=A0A9D4KFC6_DREPO|nr:hypothetical protein DPMN_111935 [Dreissena polymorpha]